MSKSDSNDKEMTRREYNALVGSGVALSHAGDGGGILSGLFGSTSDDGPGILEDTEYRNEGQHVITDPEIIDFVGDAVDINRPNEYDKYAQIRISGGRSSGGSSTPDTIVDSTSDLESTFNTLSAGEYVYIKAPDTPYRTSQWLDVEASNVRIEFESQFADDGQPIVKVADGANVGGIRVGPGTTTRTDVTISGVGYHGNDLNQDSTVKYLHGVILDNTEDCRVERCFATRTSPYHEHNTGGSGVSVKSRSSDFLIDNCWFDDIGDRGVQAAGNGGRITRIRSRNGFDRCVALGLEEDDGTTVGADNIVVNGVDGRDNAEGSIVGWGGAGTPTGQYIITNVHARGSYRSAIRGIDNGAIRINVSNVLSVGTGEAVHITDGADRVKLSNIYSTQQIDIKAGRVVMDNIIIRGSGGDGVLIRGGDKLLASNILIDNPGGVGFFNRGADNVLVNGLFVRGADDKGLADNDVGTNQRFVNVDISGSFNADVNTRGTDTYVSGGWDTVTDSGTRTRLNGIGSESANAESPTPSNWHSGEIVDFTDSGDGSGTDRYIRLPVTHASDWIRLSDAALV